MAYNTFRNGFPDSTLIPRWEDAPVWVRDVVLVAYLQGKLDAPKATPLNGKTKEPTMSKVHMQSIRKVIRFGVPATITGTLCNRMAAGEDINSTGDETEVTCKFRKSRLRAIEFSRVGSENAKRANRRDGLS